jgi:hypothetical protein
MYIICPHLGVCSGAAIADGDFNSANTVIYILYRLVMRSLYTLELIMFAECECIVLETGSLGELLAAQILCKEFSANNKLLLPWRSLAMHNALFAANTLSQCTLNVFVHE